MSNDLSLSTHYDTSNDDHHPHHSSGTHHQPPPSSQRPLSLAGRLPFATSIRASLVAFKSLIHTTSIGLAAICVVAICGGIVLGFAVHPGLFVLPVLFGGVLVLLFWLSNYAQRVRRVIPLHTFQSMYD
jgi:hypothetical protein